MGGNADEAMGGRINPVSTGVPLAGERKPNKETDDDKRSQQARYLFVVP
jgi:hypothetical protein